MNIKKVIIISAVVLGGLTISNQNVSAKGGGHAGGHSSGHSSHSSTNHTSTSSRGTTASKAGVNSSKITSGTAKISRSYGSKAATQITNTTKVTQRMNISSPKQFSAYAHNPYDYSYRNYYGGMNPWFYVWLFSSSWNQQQQQQARVMGITQNEAQELKKNSKTVTIGTGDESKSIIVTPNQYDKINKGDKVKMSDDGLFINGKKIK